MAPAIRALGKVNGFRETSSEEILQRFYLKMVGASQSVKTRAVSNPSPTVSGTGDTVVKLLQTDNYGFEIEGGSGGGLVETVTARCVQDQLSSARKWESVWELRGANQDALFLDRLGTGEAIGLTEISARDGSSRLRNGAFLQISESGALTGLDDWVADGTGWASDASNYYRAYPGFTPYSLSLTSTVEFYQSLDSIGKGILSEGPWFLRIIYNAEIGTAVDSLRIDLGAVNNSVTVDGLTGWRELIITLGANCWARQFYENNLTVNFKFTRTSGTLKIGEITLGTMARFGLGYYAMLSGVTPSKVGDTGSWSFTETGSEMQFWTQYAHNGLYLPHDASPTIVDPS
jgi:hypothetical protein